MNKHPVCRHCRREPVSRPRGLCWSCYYRPGIRDLYPTDPVYGRRGTGYSGSELPEPTAALPGTPGKVLVLEERAALGLALFHPNDARDADLS